MPRERHQAVLRLSPDVHAKLKHIAQKDGRSVNNMIEYILRRYLEAYEREHGEIKPLEE